MKQYALHNNHSAAGDSCNDMCLLVAGKLLSERRLLQPPISPQRLLQKFGQYSSIQISRRYSNEGLTFNFTLPRETWNYACLKIFDKIVTKQSGSDLSNTAFRIAVMAVTE